MIQVLQILTVIKLHKLHRFIYCELKQLNGKYLMIT